MKSDMRVMVTWSRVLFVHVGAFSCVYTRASLMSLWPHSHCRAHSWSAKQRSNAALYGYHCIFTPTCICTVTRPRVTRRHNAHTHTSNACCMHLITTENLICGQTRR